MKLKDTLKYRNAWLGIAMLMIVWYHSKLLLPGAVLGFAKSIGYGGVDICLFASGIGCWFSLDSNGDYLPFMKRRLRRVMPAYLCFIPFWILFRMLTDPISPLAILGNILAFQYYTGLGEHFNWYIGGILILYIISPLLKYMMDQRGLKLAGCLFALLFLSVLFWGSDTYIVLLTRLPIFCLGMLYARRCAEGSKIGFCALLGLGFGALLGLLALKLAFARYEEAALWSYGLFWYPFILIAPAICILFAWLMQHLQRLKITEILLKGLEKIGQYSFEIYLTHLLIFDLLFYLINSGYVLDTIYIWLASLLPVCLCSILLRRLTNKIWIYKKECTS